MVRIKKNFVAESKYNLKCPYEMVPQYVVIHNTANNATAQNEIAYMKRNRKEVSFHYAVDHKEIVQGIPESRNAWHAGDGGQGKGNRCGIAIEICHSKSGGTKFEKAEKNAAELAADILRRYGWGVERLMRHRDFSGKYCPHRTMDLGWQRFVDMVQAALDGKPIEKKPAAPKYTVGRTYRLKVDALSVRSGAGKHYARKTFSQLTKNAQANAYASGHLKKGTYITCLGTKKSGNDVWMRIPSGWVAAYYKGKYYIK